MTPIRVLLCVAALVAGATAPAFADGTVLRATGCGDKVFVASENGYSVLRGAEPGATDDGDKLVGDVERYGFGSFYDAKSDRRFSASVDERGLDKAQVTQRIAGSCRAANAQNFASGQVERAAGCGNKIFVNTDTGYAVMERLAGGLVYAGDTLTGDFNKAGRATVKDKQTGAELVVFVDDYQLPKSAAQRKITEACR
jgi:hypothetical protein